MSIDIAIIDSGVNPWHSHVQGVAGGVCLRRHDTGDITESKDYLDSLGHGTAIAGIVREKIPEARLYAVKIFERKLAAPASLLLAAMKWAMMKQVNIIHLSLGLEKREFRQDLERICRKAFERNIVIVAAARTADDHVYPSTFKTVIGVYWNRDCDMDCLVYHPGNSIEFGTYGQPRALPGMPQKLNFRGSSFAAAHVTGMAGRLLKRNPAGGHDWLKDGLIKKAKEDIWHHEEKAIFT